MSQNIMEHYQNKVIITALEVSKKSPLTLSELGKQY